MKAKVKNVQEKVTLSVTQEGEVIGFNYDNAVHMGVFLKSKDLKITELRTRAEDYKRELIVYKRLYAELLDKAFKELKSSEY
jgi:hypothetical protein